MALMENDPILTTDEAIEYLRISKPTFLKLIHQGNIKAVWAGKRWRQALKKPRSALPIVLAIRNHRGDYLH